MSKNASQKENTGHQQPLLAGINLARCLCDECPFLRLGSGSRRLKELGPKSELGGPAPAVSAVALPRQEGDLTKPGTL